MPSAGCVDHMPGPHTPQCSQGRYQGRGHSPSPLDIVQLPTSGRMQVSWRHASSPAMLSMTLACLSHLQSMHLRISTFMSTHQLVAESPLKYHVLITMSGNVPASLAKHQTMHVDRVLSNVRCMMVLPFLPAILTGAKHATGNL